LLAVLHGQGEGMQGKLFAMDVPVLDLRGLKCPLPVLKTRKRIRGMVAGNRLWVEATDPLSVVDIPHFCREDGHLLIEYREQDGIRCFLIERGIVQEA
jgi:tRNA 2-thiouridine synthesizing protein A